MVEQWILIALTGAVCSGLFNIYQKQLLTTDFEPLELVFVTNIFAALLLSPIVLLADVQASVTLLVFATASGLVNAVSFVLLAKAYNTGSLSLVAPLRGIVPVLVAAVEPLFFARLDYTRSLLLASGIVGIGLYVLFYEESIFRPIRRLQDRSVQVGLASSVVIVFAVLIDARALVTTDINPILYALYLTVTTVFFLSLVPLFRRNNPVEQFRADRRAVVIGLLRGLNLALIFGALSITAATRVNIVLQLGPVIAAVVGGSLFNESNLLVRTLGSVLILSSSIIVIL